ncbi:hypothetical protein ACFQ0M_05945 [Kitasatospora aburaviensis]
MADEQLQAWLADRLHRLVTATVATPPLDIHSLRPVPYADGHGGETFAPATAIRRAAEPLDRPGVSWYDNAGWELCAEDADGVTGLKRTFFEHRGAGPRDGLPAPVHLIQHLLRLLIEGAERHVDDGEEGEPPRMGTALLTYPTSALPQDREKLGRLVQEGLSIDTVDLRIDEGLAAGLYFLMRDLTANLELGLESLRASARPVPGRTDQWQRIMLVVDIGGGTSDIALLEMTLTDDTRLADPARAFVAGRHYKLSPRILGTIGHGQLGGDLLTLHVLYWIKARLVDALGPGRTMEDTAASRCPSRSPSRPARTARSWSPARSGPSCSGCCPPTGPGRPRRRTPTRWPSARSASTGCGGSRSRPSGCWGRRTGRT